LRNITDEARDMEEGTRKTFVHDLVLQLLIRLHSDLFDLETELSNAIADKVKRATNSDLVFLSIPPTGTRQGEQEVYIVQGANDGIVERGEILQWIKSIYLHGNGNLQKVVGPVGERPIHVCFLFANMFGVNDNIRKGILEAVKSFMISTTNRYDILKKNELKVSYGEEYCAEELKMRYGKDYCAALGTVICRLNYSVQSKLKANLPPFLHCIETWVKNYVKLPKFDSTHAKVTIDNVKEEAKPTDDDLSREDFETLVTAGLYEGETVLHFPITSKDLDTVKWLLEEGLRYDVLNAPSATILCSDLVYAQRC
jgi:hypothetical protein